VIKLCGLWLHTSKHGNKTISGNWGGVRIILSKNKFKTKEDHPDYNLFLVEREHKKKFDPTGDIQSDLSDVASDPSSD